MKYIAFGQAVGSLEIQWSEHLPGHNRSWDVRRIFCNLSYYAISQQFALLIPIAMTQTVRHVLHKTCKDVSAGRCKGCIGIRGYDTVHPELFGNLPKFGDVIATFRKLER